jgi:ribose transport system substrate-binding protein
VNFSTTEIGMTTRIVRRLAALTVGAGLLACGGGGQQAGDTTKAAAGAAGGQGAAAGDGKYTIAMIAKSSNNPVFLASRNGAEAAAREISQKQGIQVEVLWMTPPQEDGQVQAQRIQQAVNSGADAILISASDAGKVQGAINDAVDRGVPVMTFDSDVPQSKRFAYYGVDDLETGRKAMSELAQLMGARGGTVGILAGNQNAPNLQARVRGVREEAAKHPGIQVIGSFNHLETPQDAAAEVTRVNNAYPDIAGWVFVGGWPLFTQSLLTDIDPKRIKVVSVDALPAQLAYVDRGVAPVLLAQPVYQWGYVGVQTIVAKLHDKKDPPQQRIPMDLVRVSKQNLGEWARQLKDWGFTDVDPKYLGAASTASAPR